MLGRRFWMRLVVLSCKTFREGKTHVFMFVVFGSARARTWFFPLVPFDAKTQV
jgi:hypothetical protein